MPFSGAVSSAPTTMSESISPLTPSRLYPTEPSGYIGRFAPSPTGPLHFGSLVSALASYLDAKAHGGKWWVRMEDLDPPREQPGAANEILRALEGHGLGWDGEILYQSQRLQAYQDCLNALNKAGLVYPCACSRQDLAHMGGIYNGYCRTHPPQPGQTCSFRLKLYDLPARASSNLVEFEDLIQGPQQQNLRTQAGDQILKRRDGLFAYPLAVVVDDIAQGVTHIIRGSDLLEVTGRQLFLFDLLGAPLPAFGHVPLAVQANGQKLSKQNHAKAIQNSEANKNLWRALGFLGQNPPVDLAQAPVPELLHWAKQHWRRDAVSGLSHFYTE